MIFSFWSFLIESFLYGQSYHHWYAFTYLYILTVYQMYSGRFVPIILNLEKFSYFVCLGSEQWCFLLKKKKINSLMVYFFLIQLSSNACLTVNFMFLYNRSLVTHTTMAIVIIKKKLISYLEKWTMHEVFTTSYNWIFIFILSLKCFW